MKERFVIPIFPLNAVMFPGIPLPLHIFEDRYKSMVQECQETGKNFGIIYNKGKEDIQIGCSVNISKTLNNRLDGAFDILTTGEHRFQIHKIIKTRDFLQAEVSLFDDEPYEMIWTDYKTIEDGYETLRELIKYTDEKPEQEVGPNTVDPQFLSFILATSHRFSLPDKQKFLEMRSTIGRLQIQNKALKSYIAQLKRESRISASQNDRAKYKFSLN